MKDLKDLFQAEFKNLYAMEKQTLNEIEEFPKVDNKRFEKALNRLSKSNSRNFQKIQDMNSEMELNPGNTTDSVAQELLANILEINAQSLSSEMSQAGLLASFNRLANYRYANYYNAYQMAKAAKLTSEKKQLKKLMKRSKKEAKNMMKCAKKSVFKKARS